MFAVGCVQTRPLPEPTLVMMERNASDRKRLAIHNHKIALHVFSQSLHLTMHPKTLCLVINDLNRST